jgi:transposase
VIVIGIDPHKKQHTACAVSAVTGELVGEITVPAGRRGRERLLAWARARGAARRFALEDCRHVSVNLERLLLARGEEVVRVAPKLMAGLRRAARERGKSDAIDALAVARAALREPDLPVARLDGPERELRLLVDHREDLVGERTRIQSRLRWHLHELDCPVEVPARGLDRAKWLARLETWLAAGGGVQAMIAAELVGRCRALTAAIDRLERDIAAAVQREAPALVALAGCGPLTAAKLVGEIGGVERFSTAARFAMHAGVAPIPASSGARQRHRLNRHGNRQLNCALHRLAINQGRLFAPARAFLARKQAEGHSRREALRCLKRHLANVIFRTLQPTTGTKTKAATPPHVAALT